MSKNPTLIKQIEYKLILTTLLVIIGGVLIIISQIMTYFSISMFAVLALTAIGFSVVMLSIVIYVRAINEYYAARKASHE